MKMAGKGQNKNQYRVIFKSKWRKPNSVEIRYDKDLFPKPRGRKYPKEFESLVDKLTLMYENKEFDPWVDKPPVVDGVGQKMTLKDVAKDYISYKMDNDWSEVTAYNSKNIMNQFVHTIGEDFNTRQLDYHHFNDFINRPHLSWETKRVLCTFMKTFASWLEIDPEPIRVKKRKTDIVEKPVRYFSKEDKDKMIKSIKDYVAERRAKNHQKGNRNDLWMIDFINWQHYSGMRLAETLSLTRDNFDLEQGIVRFEQKGKKLGKRIREMEYAKVNILKEIAERRLADNHKLFTRSYVQTIKRHRFFRERALPDRKDLSIHSWRHTCAKDLLNRMDKVKDIIVVKDWLGHEDIQATMRYAQLFSPNLAEKVADIFNKPR